MKSESSAREQEQEQVAAVRPRSRQTGWSLFHFFPGQFSGLGARLLPAFTRRLPARNNLGYSTTGRWSVSGLCRLSLPGACSSSSFCCFFPSVILLLHSNNCPSLLTSFNPLLATFISGTGASLPRRRRHPPRPPRLAIGMHPPSPGDQPYGLALPSRRANVTVTRRTSIHSDDEGGDSVGPLSRDSLEGTRRYVSLFCAVVLDCCMNADTFPLTVRCEQLAQPRSTGNTSATYHFRDQLAAPAVGHALGPELQPAIAAAEPGAAACAPWIPCAPEARSRTKTGTA